LFNNERCAMRVTCAGKPNFLGKAGDTHRLQS
jgi:hypothetical protein